MKVSTLMPVLAICALLSFTSCSTESMNEEEVLTIDLATPPQAKPLEIEVLELINNYRISNGFSALSNNGTVKAVAYTHSDYMRISNEVSHHNFYVRKQSLQENENAQVVSENVAFGYTNAQSVVNAWINSPGHRSNIEGDFTHFDISAEQDENGDWYYTNIFIKR
ncbi:cysteine-rich secretory family protein [Winogradskyella wandonensis]|uniref:Cysteine-rich secretory family protein n=1 Tax=Winogradskyella wandonensis TaxID=1442586 RepID=A0A4R1KV90_9FLAO|nr:CAP domain-containing protein [Winogradskyella wandonensis]TCK69095.1 cysteine-rich secretory family protein [Winogradskyella wandonensis]